MTKAEFVREIAQPLSGSANDYGALLELIGDARFVLLAKRRTDAGELPETYPFKV
jgi:hypothetical protein